MTCPKCKNKINLSNKIYFKTLLGKYTCTNCNSNFKLIRKTKYLLWLLIGFILAISSSYYISINSDSSIIFIAWLLFLFLVFTQIDRKVENSLESKII